MELHSMYSICLKKLVLWDLKNFESEIYALYIGENGENIPLFYSFNS